MTRRLLLGASSSGAVVPIDPPDGGGGDPDPDPVTGWPETDDPIILAMRPTGRSVATNIVGPSRTLTTVLDGVVAGGAAVEADGFQGAGYWDGRGPDYRATTIADPGTYTSGIGYGGWAALVGATGDPEDVIIQDKSNGGGTMHSFGSSYIEGLTLRAFTDGDELSPKYAWHITGGHQQFAVNCVFDVSDAEPAHGSDATSGVVGKDGEQGMVTIFYRCHFRGREGIRGFNMHAGAPGPHSEVIAFIDCTTEGIIDIGGCGHFDLEGNPSRLYVIGLSGDEYLATIGADFRTAVYTDSDLPTQGGPPLVVRDVAEWPVPVDGLAPHWADHFYPSAIGDEPTTFTPSVSDAAPMQPVVGRTYVTRVRLEEAMRVNSSGLVCTVAGGDQIIDLTPCDTPYARNEPPPMTALYYPVNPVVVGQNFGGGYPYTRYPGDNGFWHRSTFTSASARVNASAHLPGITDCYYTDDDVTLVPVAEGTPHPLPFLRAT